MSRAIDTVYMLAAVVIVLGGVRVASGMPDEVALGYTGAGFALLGLALFGEAVESILARRPARHTKAGG